MRHGDSPLTVTNILTLLQHFLGRVRSTMQGPFRRFCDGYHIPGGKSARSLPKILSGRKNAQPNHADRGARDTAVLFDRNVRRASYFESDPKRRPMPSERVRNEM